MQIYQNKNHVIYIAFNSKDMSINSLSTEPHTQTFNLNMDHKCVTMHNAIITLGEMNRATDTLRHTQTKRQSQAPRTALCVFIVRLLFFFVFVFCSLTRSASSFFAMAKEQFDIHHTPLFARPPAKHQHYGLSRPIIIIIIKNTDFV